MTSHRLLLAATLAAGLAACGKSSQTDSFAAGTPTVAGLTLETTGGTGDGLVATTSSGAAALTVDATAAATTTCQSWEFTCQLRQGIVGVNTFVRAALEPVEALVAEGPSSSPSDAVRVYGPTPLPASAPVASFQLTVRALGNQTYRWKLEAQPVAGGAFSLVMAGQLHIGDAPHRGRGFLGMDLDAFAAVNPAFGGKGKLFAVFAHAGAAKSLVYAAQGFAADATATPVTAFFTGWKDASGRARVRLAAKGEYLAPNGGGADAGPELLLSRIGWWPAVGGRTAVAVLDGDVASYATAGFTPKAFVGLECFGAGIDVTYRALFTCGSYTGSLATVCSVVPAWLHAVGANADGSPVAGACQDGTVAFDPTAVGTDPASPEPEPDAPVTPSDTMPSMMPAF